MDATQGHRPSGRIRRAFFHPRAALALSLCMLADLWYWCSYRYDHLPLLAAPCCAVSQMGVCRLPRFTRTVIVQRDNKFELVDLGTDEGWALWDAEPRPPEVRGETFYHRRSHSSGLLAPVFRTQSYSFHISCYDQGRDFTEGELSQIRDSFCGFQQSAEGGMLAGTEEIEHLRARDTAVTTWNGLALTHDLAALAGLVAIGGGTRRFIRERAERKRRLAIEREHQCPACRYDITGLTDRCPECGGSIALPPGPATDAKPGMVQWDSPSDPLP